MSIMQTSGLKSLGALKEQGLSLVEVKISQVSFAKGQLLSNIRLPENTRIVCVIRNNRPIMDLDAVFLEERDTIHLVTDDENLVRDIFTI